MGKTAGDGKVTGTVIDFLLTGYFAGRITTNAFPMYRLPQVVCSMDMKVHERNCA